MIHWQGIEQEFRVKNGAHGSAIVDAIRKYKLFDEEPAFVSESDSGVVDGLDGDNRDGFLRNGSRIYLCGCHPEIATPECRNAYEVLKYDKASEFYIQLGAELASVSDSPIQCWKANVEVKRLYSRGTHESYSIATNWNEKKNKLLGYFLALRQVFCGAGGYLETRTKGRKEYKYVLSPRAMIVDALISFDHRKRPMFTIKDTSDDNMRIHVSMGEGLRLEVARLLNNGITSYVISAIEREKIKEVPAINNIIKTVKRISKNTEGSWKISLYNKRRVSVIDYLNTYYLSGIESLFEEEKLDYWDNYIIDTFKRVLKKLDEGLIESPFLHQRLDWTLKKYIIENEIDNFSCDIYYDDDISKKISACFDFTNVCDYDLYEKTADKIGVKRVLTEQDIAEAILEPPANSRAALRVRIARELQKVTMGWNYAIVSVCPEIKIKRVNKKLYNEIKREENVLRIPKYLIERISKCLTERDKIKLKPYIPLPLFGEEDLLLRDVEGEKIKQIVKNIESGEIRHVNELFLLLSILREKTYLLEFNKLDWNDSEIREKIEDIKERTEEERNVIEVTTLKKEK